ncbi:MAG: hypothetical protein HOV86_05800 [Thermoactinospora sp.]|nr:hypothetical protein [Thermoactinospora sp.]
MTLHHHPSHRKLLQPATEATPLDTPAALVVPTIRSPHRLEHAVKLAAELGCQLVLLCSRRWSSASTAAALYRRSGARILAVDVPEPDQLALPRFRTDALLRGTVFERRSDLSAKRNLALLLAKQLGWRNIVFLDDDIHVPRSHDLRLATGLLSRYEVVGLDNTGYPDNSVVCHAFRAIGGAQDSFVGGGAMAVRTTRVRSFFPNIYNEDWFYLLKDRGLRQVGVAGKVAQQPYDPFRTDERARAEEFGDLLAEGLYWLLDDGNDLIRADHGYWTEAINRRRRFIDHILANDHGRRPGLADALLAARGRLTRHISAALCVAYLDAWRRDRETWRKFVHTLHQTDSPDEALSRWNITTPDNKKVLTSH